MTGFSRRRCLPLWPILTLFLLTIRAPTEATQSAGLQSDTARDPGAAARSEDAARKPAWKWTLEERLAARFDPQAIAAREALREAEPQPSFKHWQNGRLVKEDTEL